MERCAEALSVATLEEDVVTPHIGNYEPGDQSDDEDTSLDGAIMSCDEDTNLHRLPKLSNASLAAPACLTVAPTMATISMTPISTSSESTASSSSASSAVARPLLPLPNAKVRIVERENKDNDDEDATVPQSASMIS